VDGRGAAEVRSRLPCPDLGHILPNPDLHASSRTSVLLGRVSGLHAPKTCGGGHRQTRWEAVKARFGGQCEEVLEAEV